MTRSDRSDADTRIAQWFGRRLRDETGAVLILAAVSMVAFLGMAAIAIDLGSLWRSQRQAQTAADAAALAGMQDLPTSMTAQATAQAYVSKNLPGSVVTVTTPYRGDPQQIRVTVSATIATPFAAILGSSSSRVSASATAKKNPAFVPSALFAHNTSCSGYGVTLESNDETIVGGTHSNGALTIQSDRNSGGTVSYGGPNQCSASAGPGTYTTLTRDPISEPWPVDYSVNPPACTFSGTSFDFGASDSTIPAGVYCATGRISLSGDRIKGNVTFIADSFSITGTNSTLTPFYDKLSIYQTGTSDLNINASNISGGTVFAPRATVIFSGSYFTSTGFIEADRIDLQGDHVTLKGNGPAMAGGAGALTE